MNSSVDIVVDITRFDHVKEKLLLFHLPVKKRIDVKKKLGWKHDNCQHQARENTISLDISRARN